MKLRKKKFIKYVNKKKKLREKKKRGEDIPDVEKKRRSWCLLERKKERDVDVCYIRGRRRKRRKGGSSVVKWGILVFLLGYFTDG